MLLVKLCSWTNGKGFKFSGPIWANEISLGSLLADKALHPIVQVIMIVSSAIFQWCYHIDGDGWQLMCSVVYIWWYSSFGM